MRLDSNPDKIRRLFDIELAQEEYTYMASKKIRNIGDTTPALQVNPKTLFEGYQVADDAVETARMALDAAMAERSLKVKAIKEILGDGPFQWHGKMLKPFKRDTKSEDGTVIATTHFFRELGGELNVIG
jgi:hypothetical protein